MMNPLCPSSFIVSTARESFVRVFYVCLIKNESHGIYHRLQIGIKPPIARVPKLIIHCEVVVHIKYRYLFVIGISSVVHVNIFGFQARGETFNWLREYIHHFADRSSEFICSHKICRYSCNCSRLKARRKARSAAENLFGGGVGMFGLGWERRRDALRVRDDTIATTYLRVPQYQLQACLATQTTSNG